MGYVSYLEDDEKHAEAAAIEQRPTASDLAALMAAPVSPRPPKERSKPNPKLKPTAVQKQEAKKYRKLKADSHVRPASAKHLLAMQTENSNLKAEIVRLKAHLASQIAEVKRLRQPR